MSIQDAKLIYFYQCSDEPYVSTKHVKEWIRTHCFSEVVGSKMVKVVPAEGLLEYVRKGESVKEEIFLDLSEPESGLNDEMTFLDACQVERDAFVAGFKERFPFASPKLRVWAENILIMYDQLVERERVRNEELEGH